MKKNIVIEQVQPVGQATWKFFGAQEPGEENYGWGFCVMIRLFRHYVPASLVVLAISEFLIFFLAIYLGVEVRFIHQGTDALVSVEPLFPKALLFAIVMQGAMTSMGLYWRNSQINMVGMLHQIFLAFSIGIVAMLILFYAFPAAFIGRGALAFSLLIALLGILAVRVFYYFFTDHDALKRRLLVLGAGELASQLEQELNTGDMAPGLKIIGFIQTPGQPVQVDTGSVISAHASLMETVKQHQAQEIVVALDERREYFPVREILDCKMNGVQITDITNFLEQRTSKIRLDTMHPSTLIFADGYSHAVLASYGKRMLDISASLALLAVSWPVMLLTAMTIYLESGGKGTILYRQERVGKDGIPFNVLKFRSMRMDAEKDGKAQWASKDDDRVTRIGRVIRKYRIDELPQLLNVLKGDMSFVGPRPERPLFVQELSSKIPYYGLRHKVNPGITGWAQICYPYGSSDQDALEKLQYDLYYIKNYSLWFDFLILAQTVYAVLSGRGGR